MVENSAILQLSPNVLTFDVSGKKDSTASLNIANPSGSIYAFKVKTSSHKSFLVSPAQGLVKPNDSVTLSVKLLYSDDVVNKIHKFMIQEQRLLQFDLTKANWEDPSVKSQKIAGNVVFENSIDGGIQYDDPPQRSPGKTVNDSFKSYDMNESFASIREPSVLIQEYPQLPTINELEQLEDQKKSLSNRSTELTKQIDKLERDIENANHKLKFAQETELFYSPTGEGQCTIKHLFITLIIGFIIGYVFLG